MAHINLGIALSELDDDEEAVLAFENGLKSLTTNIKALMDVARCLRALDEYPKAIKYFKKAVSLSPKHSHLYWELGYCLELSGDKKSAEQAYDKCSKHHPGHYVAMHLLNSLIGNTTALAPPIYITELFQNYADSFAE